MIISASRRTDIPSYYSEWFFNRIKAKFILVRNPMNLHQVSYINISSDVIDCIVFCTKNPKPMLSQLDKLKDYPYYFQFTLNSYGKDVEENIQLEKKQIIESFKQLSDKIGSDRIIWRYDPIFLNPKYTIDYHTQYFENIASQLKGYTKKCTISFIDEYPKIKANMVSLNIQNISNEQKREIAKSISNIAFKYGLEIDTCAEDIELSDLGIMHAKCIDDKLIEKITGYPLTLDKDKNQRLECGYVSSIDIGLYNTCQNGCKYCYANHNLSIVKSNCLKYNSEFPLLCSNLENDDKISKRNVKSLKENQLSLIKLNSK